MFKSKNLLMAMVVVITLVLSLHLTNASAGNPFTKIKQKLNEILHLLNDEVIPRLDPIGVPKTGVTTSYGVIGDDGDLQMGRQWSHPRYTDNGNGTVTDNLNGLIWLKKADCPGIVPSWHDALAACNNLASGDCGLSDDSVPGDWRMPNIKELRSLIHYGFTGPAVPDTNGTGQWSEGDPFSGVGTWYWSSNTNVANVNYAWTVAMHDGSLDYRNKTVGLAVWSVRGGN